MTIPQALRQQVWVQYNGTVFKHKCRVMVYKYNICI